MAKVKELAHKKSADDIKRLEVLLERCFKLYRVPKVRPIVLEILKTLPSLPSK